MHNAVRFHKTAMMCVCMCVCVCVCVFVRARSNCSIDKALHATNGSDPALSVQNGVYRQFQSTNQVSRSCFV